MLFAGKRPILGKFRYDDQHERVKCQKRILTFLSGTSQRPMQIICQQDLNKCDENLCLHVNIARFGEEELGRLKHHLFSFAEFRYLLEVHSMRLALEVLNFRAKISEPEHPLKVSVGIIHSPLDSFPRPSLSSCSSVWQKFLTVFVALQWSIRQSFRGCKNNFLLSVGELGSKNVFAKNFLQTPTVVVCRTSSFKPQNLLVLWRCEDSVHRPEGFQVRISGMEDSLRKKTKSFAIFYP